MLIEGYYSKEIFEFNLQKIWNMLSINFWVCIIIDFILNHSINIRNRKTKPSKGGNESEKNISGNVDDI